MKIPIATSTQSAQEIRDNFHYEHKIGVALDDDSVILILGDNFGESERLLEFQLLGQCNDFIGFFVKNCSQHTRSVLVKVR